MPKSHHLPGAYCISSHHSPKEPHSAQSNRSFPFYKVFFLDMPVSMKTTKALKYLTIVFQYGINWLTHWSGVGLRCTKLTNMVQCQRGCMTDACWFWQVDWYLTIWRNWSHTRWQATWQKWRRWWCTLLLQSHCRWEHWQFSSLTSGLTCCLPSRCHWKQPKPTWWLDSHVT